MAHNDWLLREPDKSVLNSPGSVRGKYAFIQSCKFWRGNLVLMFVGKVRTITRPRTLVLLFLKAVCL